MKHQNSQTISKLADSYPLIYISILISSEKLSFHNIGMKKI